MTKPDAVEYDTDSTDEVTCPHCGHEHSDSFEYGHPASDTGTADCDECGKSFKWQCEYTITYTTRKP
jgi:transcription elongation factor Elf1